MIITVDAAGSVPVFQQVYDQIVAAVQGGRLSAGSRLPSVRQLAGDLGIAPNTVAKAYKQLEADGVVRAHGRRGTVVIGPQERGEPEESRAAALLYARSAQRDGLDLPDAIALLRRSW